MRAVYPKPDQQLKDRLRNAYREVFPQAFVDVSDGWQGRLHVVIVSREFDEMPDKERDHVLMEIARSVLGEEAVRISLLLPYSPDDLK